MTLASSNLSLSPNPNPKVAGGLASAIFEAYPEANVYLRRTSHSQPGTIDVTPCSSRADLSVVTLFAQHFPGKPNSTNDTHAHRLRWFRQTLDAFAQHNLLTGEAVAMPFNIGCALAGGHWPLYRTAIEAWAESYDVYVRLYDLDGNSQDGGGAGGGGGGNSSSSPSYPIGMASSQEPKKRKVRAGEVVLNVCAKYYA